MPAARVRFALPVLILALAACRLIPLPRAEPTRFYTLELPVPQQVRSGAQAFALGLGPITFPNYLEQSQIAMRLDDERVAYAPADRWAGSLRNQFERALALRLMSELDTSDVATFPWWPGRRIDASVQLNVLAFEPDASRQARLDAIWKVMDAKHQHVFGAGEASLREPIDSGGQPAAVAALDRVLARLAQAIARDVRRLTP